MKSKGGGKNKVKWEVHPISYLERKDEIGALGKPSSVVIFGKTYKIEYVDNPAEVDIHKRQSLWGQIDYWTHTIRIYDNGRSIDGVFESLVHEVLHALDNELHLKIDDKSDHHEILTRLAGGLADTLVRNGWVKL